MSQTFDYWKSWLRQAFHDTAFLARDKMLYGLAVAIIGLGLQRALGLHPWTNIGEIMFTVLIAYVIVWLCAWAYNVLCTPVTHAIAKESEITHLKDALELPDKELAAHVRELLACVGENGKTVLRFILWHGEMSPPQIKIAGITDKEIYETLRLCYSQNLLRIRVEGSISYESPLRSLFGTLYYVPEELKATLNRLLSNP
jgi:hypothetical protein